MKKEVFMSLFQEGEFTGHSGGQLKWKIECDALEIDDWKCLATMIMDFEKRPFQAAIGIPRGGVMLGSFLNHYSTQNPKDPYLICDDVLTTGGSMIEFRDKYFSKSDSFGWVIWSRIPVEDRYTDSKNDWISALFTMPQ